MAKPKAKAAGGKKAAVASLGAKRPARHGTAASATAAAAGKEAAESRELERERLRLVREVEKETHLSARREASEAARVKKNLDRDAGRD